MSNRIWFLRNETPYKSALWPIVFSGKRLMSEETCYCNIEREALSIL